MKKILISTACAAALCVPTIGAADDDGRALQVRTTQDSIVNGDISFDEIRLRGRQLFSTPFTKADGYGDGPAAATPEERRTLGNRATLQDNGTFLRINGLDAQTCLECHSVGSRAEIPMRFTVGGAGGVNNTVLGGGGASFINANNDPNQINDPDGFGTTGAQNLNGRIINPPFVFGSGGIELVGNEMTQDLQALANGLANGATVALVTKGISFGSLTRNDDGSLDTSAVEGVEANADSDFFLVVQPFGRKGNNITTRTFDLDAMQFHHGMQPVEIVGEGVDADGDGVVNELLIGELSALNIFSAALERPTIRGKAREGRALFNEVGCAECHTPTLQTNSRSVGMRFPEIAQDPAANVYFNVDLSRSPTNFKRNRQGGVSVDLFADLKRHNMGPSLAEFNGDANFTTARLWGVADTAPYLHDGRALTIREAIDMHGQAGSEAETAVSNFNALSADSQEDVLDFLGTLRTPRRVGRGLDRLARKLEKDDDDDDDDKDDE